MTAGRGALVDLAIVVGVALLLGILVDAFGYPGLTAFLVVLVVGALVVLVGSRRGRLP